MTYRELMIKLLKDRPEMLDQDILVFNEGDDRFYSCTGYDRTTAQHDADIESGRFFIMVYI